MGGGGRGLPGQVPALGRPVRLALLLGSSLSWGACAAANQAPGCGFMPPQSLSSTEPKWAGPTATLGPHPAGNGQEHPLQPLPTRAAITSTNEESQRDAPVGPHP